MYSCSSIHSEVHTTIDAGEKLGARNGICLEGVLLAERKSRPRGSTSSSGMRWSSTGALDVVASVRPDVGGYRGRREVKSRGRGG